MKPLCWAKGQVDQPTVFEREAEAKRVRKAEKVKKAEQRALRSREQRQRNEHAALLRAVRKAKLPAGGRHHARRLIAAAP
jgi:hypothetical protein